MAAVRDLLADGMNPIKRVEKEERFSGKRIRGCGEQDTAILGLAHPVNSNGSAGDVAGEFFQPACRAEALAKAGCGSSSQTSCSA